ncbi:MAG: 2,3-bisphosphoglycerate-independent phosphoglycerate mutase [Oscillospiraceae bacterium]|nr:2,3-bisphosphoglycerate-independent phosphoglycerate mutase [Oscillospiraceae bacterium]
MPKPLILIILDGYGISNEEGNAITAAKSPNLEKFFANFPFTKLQASGEDVGLPEGQMGNSEVGHTNIGAGRVVYQDLTRIIKEIREGSFFENHVLIDAINAAIKNKKSLHFIGLLSDGGVHSHNLHLYALLDLAKRCGASKAYIHAILDGRDVSPSSGGKFLEECESKIKEIGIGSIASVIGRYYAMDRDNRWDRVESAYNALTKEIKNSFQNSAEVISRAYSSGLTDEFLTPAIIKETKRIESGDSVIFFNFRPDRAREITRSFVDPNFENFNREKFLKVNYVCMTSYDAEMPNVTVAFKPDSISSTFGEYISKKGLKQLRIAETEKYAHVTFFFNGGVEKVYSGEKRILIPSPKIATYDTQPKMSAFEVTEKVLEHIKSGLEDVIILNFANCDMVGHTGNFEAAIAAVEAVDNCVGRIIEEIENVQGVAIITADHGNADKMFEKDGSPFTAHTTNPVPFCVIGYPCALKKDGNLADIAPTMLEILDLEKPEEMKGESIILPNN